MSKLIRTFLRFLLFHTDETQWRDSSANVSNCARARGRTLVRLFSLFHKFSAFEILFCPSFYFSIAHRIRIFFRFGAQSKSLFCWTMFRAKRRHDTIERQPRRVDTNNTGEKIGFLDLSYRFRFLTTVLF